MKLSFETENRPLFLQSPASLITLLTKFPQEKGIEMSNDVSEIPIYIQHRNPKVIKTVMEKLVQLLKIEMICSICPWIALILKKG